MRWDEFATVRSRCQVSTLRLSLSEQRSSSIDAPAIRASPVLTSTATLSPLDIVSVPSDSISKPDACRRDRSCPTKTEVGLIHSIRYAQSTMYTSTLSRPHPQSKLGDRIASLHLDIPQHGTPSMYISVETRLQHPRLQHLDDSPAFEPKYTIDRRGDLVLPVRNEDNGLIRS